MTTWDCIQQILEALSNDPEPVVQESCIVALDTADYWGHSGSQ